jgi:hypothetical protein
MSIFGGTRIVIYTSAVAALLMAGEAPEHSRSSSHCGCTRQTYYDLSGSYVHVILEVESEFTLPEDYLYC